MKKNFTASFIVVLHFVVLAVHGKAHMQLQIGARTWQNAFIAIVIFAGPVLSLALLWTRLRRIGVLALALTMSGSLVFGIAYHFLLPGMDNVAGHHHGEWESLFTITAVGL